MRLQLRERVEETALVVAETATLFALGEVRLQPARTIRGDFLVEELPEVLHDLDARFRQAEFFESLAS
jgi:hypothetical protein